MSCHFHLMRKRRAAQKAAEAAQKAETAVAVENTNAKPEAAQKAAKGRRKGDA